MPDFRLPHDERLRSFGAVRRLFQDGHGGFVYPFRYTFLVRAAEGIGENVNSEAEQSVGRIEVMFSVPKKFHKRANKRNLLKRRTREAYRLSREELKAKVEASGSVIDVAFVYSTKEIHSYKTISHAVQRILEQIGSRL